MSKNIEMNYKTNSGAYEVLYPRTLTANVTDLNSYYYTKSQINSTFPTLTYLKQNYYTKSQTNSQIDSKIKSYGDSVIEPIGTIKCTARTDLGNDWLLCNGQSFSSSDYPGLASLLPASATSAWQLVGSDKCPVEGRVFKVNNYYCKVKYNSSSRNITLYYTTVYSSNQNMTWNEFTLDDDIAFNRAIIDIEDFVYISEISRYVIICSNAGGLSGKRAINLYVSTSNNLTGSWQKNDISADINNSVLGNYVGSYYFATRRQFQAFWELGSVGLNLIINFKSNGSYQNSSINQIISGISAQTGGNCCFPLALQSNILLAECDYMNISNYGCIAYKDISVNNSQFQVVSSDYYFGNKQTKKGWGTIEVNKAFLYGVGDNYGESSAMLSFNFSTKKYENAVSKIYFPKPLVGNNVSNCTIKSGNLNYFLDGKDGKIGAISDSQLQLGNLGTSLSSTIADGLIVGSDRALYAYKGNDLYVAPGGVVPNISGGSNYKYYIKGR